MVCAHHQKPMMSTATWTSSRVQALLSHFWPQRGRGLTRRHKKDRVSSPLPQVLPAPDKELV